MVADGMAAADRAHRNDPAFRRSEPECLFFATIGRSNALLVRQGVAISTNNGCSRMARQRLGGSGTMS
jgi:hypothetical protein